MAQMIKRHWFITVMLNLLVVLAVGWLLSVYLLPTKVKAEGAGESPTPVAATDPLTYDRMRTLRETLALTNQDLAAMACTQPQAQEMLRLLKNWYESNMGGWQQVEMNELAARRNLRQTMEKVYEGLDDGALLATVPQLQQTLALAKRQTEQVVDSLLPQIVAKLDMDQVNVWNTARSNRNVPSRWRYAPNISQSQIRQLLIQMRQVDSHALTMSAAENQALNSVQLSALSAARSNAQQRMGAILEAARVILPTPAEFKVTLQQYSPEELAAARRVRPPPLPPLSE